MLLFPGFTGMLAESIHYRQPIAGARYLETGGQVSDATRFEDVRGVWPHWKVNPA